MRNPNMKSSEQTNSKDILPGDYVAGFIDGEGCFALKYRRDVRHERKGSPVYFYWDIEFAILLRKDDRNLLEMIQNTLQCGKLQESKKGNWVRYAVNDMDDLKKKITPFFKKHPLYGKKNEDFLLWEKALEILVRYRRSNRGIQKGTRGFIATQWNPTDVFLLREIHNRMTKYKSKGKEWKWVNNREGREY